MRLLWTLTLYRARLVYLFGYFEYTGTNFSADMARMAADPVTQKWWSVCEPCQKPMESRAQGEWWAAMEEVFQQD